MHRDYEYVGLICARGGSKGIPNKNIRKFLGRPLLGWAVEAARKSRMLDKVIVSTDCEKIAAVARECGAEVPGLRPAGLAQDDSDVFDTHAYVFEKLCIADNDRVAILVNNPFLSADLIRKMFNMAERVNFGRLVTTAIKTYHPYYFWFRIDDDICVPYFTHDYLTAAVNRKDREIMCFPFFLGCVGKPSMLYSWKAYKREMVKGFVPVFINKKEAFDLDDEDDWEIAEAIFAATAGNRSY